MWFGPGSQTVFQAWVPFVVALLCWGRRDEWQRTREELESLFPDARDPRRSGNVFLVILGGAILLVGLLSALPSLSALGLVVMTVGAIYMLFGPFLLRVVITPLLFLLLMIPFPSGLMQALTVRYQFTGAAMLGGALELLSVKNRVLGPEVTLQASGQALGITPSLGGLGTFFFTILGTLAYLIWRRISIGRGLVALIIAGFLSCLVSVLRLLLLGYLTSNAPAVSETLQKVPALPTILIALALTWVFTRKLLSPRPRVQPQVEV